MSNLEALKDAMSRCFHCQICQASCPVYLQDLLETHCARARLGLVEAAILEGSMPVSDRLMEVMDRCLLCTRCTLACPAGVPLDTVFALARQRLRGQVGGKGTGAKGPASRAPEVPSPVAGMFNTRFEESPACKGPPRARTAYYPGCATNRLFPDTARAVLWVMAENGVEVVIPEGLSCCGLPAYTSGDLAGFREALQQNLPILADLDVDAILVDCASCGLAFKVKAQEVAEGDDALAEQAARVAEKTWEATDFLVHLGLVASPGRLEQDWTYHPPCRIGWRETAEEAPRALLGKIPGAAYRSSQTTGACCGSGDLFHLRHSTLAQGIRGRRLEEIRRTGAKTVVTQCPFCRHFLQQGAEDLAIMHPLALLQRAYGQRG